MSARRRLAALRAAVARVTTEVWFYNVDNYRPDGQIERELKAIANAFRPLVIGVTELIGNDMPTIPGYVRVRDTSTRSRQNIGAYVRADAAGAVRSRWVDLNGTWPRTEGPGTHEARSYLVLEVGRLQVVIAHQPPKNAVPAWTLQLEGINALTRVLAPWKSPRWPGDRKLAARILTRLRPRLLLWDANRRSGESGPGPDSLAKRVDGTVHGGDRIDSALTRGMIEVLGNVQKHGKIGDVKLLSDHRGAIRVRVRLLAWWLPKLSPKFDR